MIDVGKDTVGIRLALEELFEEDLARRRIRRSAENANEETLARLYRTLPERKFSPGYYRWGYHILSLDSEREAGLLLDPAQLASIEVGGLLALTEARRAFRNRHPECTACGAQQETAFAPECWKCGSKFKQKGA